jgi:hypothetical protein
MVLDWLAASDSSNAATPSRDALLLHYQVCKRLLLAGQLHRAVEQGWRLHARLRAAGSTSAADLTTAVTLHITVCVSEMGAGIVGVGSGKAATAFQQQAQRWLYDALPSLIDSLTASGTTPDAKKSLESVFKCVYKVCRSSCLIP